MGGRQELESKTRLFCGPPAPERGKRATPPRHGYFRSKDILRSMFEIQVGA